MLDRIIPAGCFALQDSCDFFLFLPFLLPAIARRSGEADGEERQKINYPVNPVDPVGRGSPQYDSSYLRGRQSPPRRAE